MTTFTINGIDYFVGGILNGYNEPISYGIFYDDKDSGEQKRSKKYSRKYKEFDGAYKFLRKKMVEEAKK